MSKLSEVLSKLENNNGIIHGGKAKSKIDTVMGNMKTFYTGVDNAYIDSFNKDYAKYINDYNNEIQNVSYDNISGIKQKYSILAQDLKSRANRINAFISNAGDGIDGKTRQQIQSSIGAASNSINSTIANIDKSANYYSQWATQEDYDKEMRGVGYYDKYKSYGYDDLMSILGDLSSGEEKDWLASNMSALLSQNEDFVEGVSKGKETHNPSVTDYEDYYARLNEMTAIENADKYTQEEVLEHYDSKPVINDPLTFYFENAVDSDTARQYSPSASGDVSSAFYKIVENGDENCWNQITEDERQAYLYTLGTKGTDAAMEYLDSLTPVLQKRQDGENARKIDEFLGQYEGFKGFLANAGATAVLIPLKLFSSLSYLNTVADVITGGDANKYSGANNFRRSLNALQSGIGREIADNSSWEIGGKNVLEQAYYLSVEGIEMAAFGSWMGPFYLALKGMGAAQDTAEDIYARGGNAGQILIGSLAAGSVEAILEKLPLDNLFGKATKESVDTIGDWFKMIGRQAGIEALEEVGTEIANNLTDDLLMGDKSNIQLRVKEILENDPQLSLGDARKQALTEKIYDLLWAASGGALLGGAGGAVFGGKYLATNNAINTQLGAELKGVGADVEGMLDYAANFKADNKLINSILKKSNADNISELNLGRLYSKINTEIESKFKNAKTFDDVKSIYNEIVNQNGGDSVLNIANYQAKKYAKSTSPLYEADLSFIKPFEKAEPNSKSGNNVVGSFDVEKGVEATTVGSKVAEPTTEQGGEIESTLPNISAQGPAADPVADAVFEAKGVERLTDDQKFIKKVGKAFGRDVKFKNLDEWRTDENGKKYLFSPNGAYNKNTGEIIINSSKNSKGNALAFIFKHELTHFAETAGESFTLFMNEVMDSQAFKDWVKSKGYADSDSVSATMAMNAEYVKRWKFNGKDAEHKANLEMVADFVGENLFAKDLTRLEQAIKQMQPKTVKTFKEWILNILDKLKTALQSIGKHTEIEALERDFVRICDEAMKNAEKKQGQKESSTEGGVEYSLSSMAYTFFGDENMSSVAFEKGDYKQTDGYKNFVEKCVNNMRQTRTDFDETVARQEIEKQIDGIVRVALAAKKAGYDIADDASKRDVKDSKNRLLFSSLEPNSDYFTSSDISTICDKRKNFAEIYDDIVRAEEEKGVPKGRRFFDNVDNYFYLHDVLAKKGLTQPCRECYVESMRKNLAPMANAFLKLVNETDVNNKANDQLYQQSGKNKGQLKSNNAELRQRVLETFEEHPEYGMSVGDLTVETLTTENGLAQLKIQAPLIYEAFNSFYGQSKPKMPKSATPFRFGELTALLTDNNGKIKQSLVDKINSTGGFRLQSYSDFQIQNYTDVLQVIFEAGTLGLNGHAYTKVPAFLEATEGTNLKRNVSIFMYKDGNEWKLDKNDSFPAESIEEIYNIVKADKSGNTGIIAVSQNKDMSCWIMANDNVAYGIPFHKSGLKMATVRDTNVKTDDGRIIKGYSGTIDHTKQQTEVWAKASADHKALTKVKKGINIYSKEVGWDFDNKGNLPKNKLIEKNVKKYIDACERAGYLPKFREYVMNNDAVLTNVLKYAKELGFVSPDATVEDISFKYKGYTIPYGYYKFLGDFSMFTPDGKVSPHEVLSLNNYNFDKAEQFFADAEGLRRNEILQQFANDGERQKYRDSNLTAEELTEIVKQKRKEVVDEIVPQAETDLEAEDMEYSISPETDAEYMDAVTNGDMETAQRLVDEVAAEAGYGVKAYHGTKDSFTVFKQGQKNQYDPGYLGSGFYFTSKKESAEYYASRKKGDGNETVMSVALKLENPLVIKDESKPHLIAVQEALGLHLTDFGDYLAPTKPWISKKITEEAKKQGYDGIVRYVDFMDETFYVVFDSNQVKSINAITYDDNGNIIPLSERFNTDNEDIRYSMPSDENEELLRQYEDGQMTKEEYLAQLDGSAKPQTLFDIIKMTEDDLSTTPKKAHKREMRIPTSWLLLTTGKELSRGDKSAIINILDALKGQQRNEAITYVKDVMKVETDSAAVVKKLRSFIQSKNFDISNTYDSLLGSSIFDSTFKSEVQKDDFIKKYETTTNKETLEQAAKELDEGGQSYVLKWFNTDAQHASLIDEAVGFILLYRYQAVGDYESAVAVAEKLREMGTAAGQSVQIFSILGRFDPTMMVAYAQKELANALLIARESRTKEWLDKNASRFKLNAEDIEFIRRRTLQAADLPEGRTRDIALAEIAQRIQDKIPPLRGQSWKAYQRICMLLNAKTNIRNVAGNISASGLFMFSDIFGANVDILAQKYAKSKGVAANRTTSYFGRGGLVENFKAFGEGAANSYDDWRRKINTRDVNADRYDVKGQGKSFNEHTGNKVKDSVAHTFNEIDRFTSFLLDVGDRPFYQMWFANSLNNQLKANKVDKPTKEMLEIAMQTALDRTWQNNNAWTRSVQNVKNVMNAVNLSKLGLDTDYGLGDVVIKFSKTPANLSRAIWQFSPMGLTTAIGTDAKNFVQSIKKGEYDPMLQQKMVDSISKGIAGTMVYILVMTLASLGYISLTGGNDEDKDVRSFENYILGMPEYSIKIGDKYYSYEWNQPMGAFLASVADYMKSKEENPDNTFFQNLEEALKAGGDVLMRQSFIKGVKEFFDAESVIDGIIDGLFGDISVNVPQLLSQLASTFDDKKRVIYTDDRLESAVNSVLAKIPGLRNTLDADVDVMGREIDNAQKSVLNAFFNPGNTYTDVSNDVTDEVYRLYKSTGKKTVFPPKASNSVTIKDVKIGLTPEEKLELQKITGETSSNLIVAAMDNDKYDDLTDEQKATLVEKIYSYSTAFAKSKVLVSQKTLAAIYGKDVVTDELYNKMTDKAKQAAIAEHYMSEYEMKFGSDTEKLTEYLIKNINDDNGKKETNNAKKLGKIMKEYQ